MSNNLKTSSPFSISSATRHFFIAFATIVVFSACTSCKEEIEIPLSNDTQLFNFKVENVPVKRWSENTFIAYANWGTETIAPTFSAPEGASVTPASGTEHSADAPIIYTVAAEDGTVAQCTLLICQAQWSLRKINADPAGLGAAVHFGNNQNETWAAAARDSIVSIQFQQENDHTSPSHKIYFGLDLSIHSFNEGVSTGTFLVNTYSLQVSQAGQATAWIRVDDVSMFGGNMFGGKITISAYDPIHRTISGSFDNIEYDGSEENCPYQIASGQFKNLPVR